MDAFFKTIAYNFKLKVKFQIMKWDNFYGKN